MEGRRCSLVFVSVLLRWGDASDVSSDGAVIVKRVLSYIVRSRMIEQRSGKDLDAVLGPVYLTNVLLWKHCAPRHIHISLHIRSPAICPHNSRLLPLFSSIVHLLAPVDNHVRILQYNPEF